ncbi:MAG: PAS domain S-box protein [Candidatus Magnetoovum sp. WYHC-5]|nr:PAS domain S-box protein [Candidatus Magnetoovum sp. WYHC-5]
MIKKNSLAESVFSSSPDIIVIVDERRRIIGYNKSAENAFGYTTDEVFGKHVDILYANVADGEKINSTIKTLGYFYGEVTNRRKNGQTFVASLSSSKLLADDGSLIGYMGISRDITHYKEAEALLKTSQERLKESEEKYHNLFKIESASIVIFDTLTGLFLDANDAAFMLYGYDKEEFLQLNYTDIIYQKEDILKDIESVVTGMCVHVPFCRHIRKDGTVFPADMVAGSYVYKGKKVVCAIIRDITLRKRTEERLQKLNKVFLKLGTDYDKNINLFTETCGELLRAIESFYCRCDDNTVNIIGQWSCTRDRQQMDTIHQAICQEALNNETQTMKILRRRQCRKRLEAYTHEKLEYDTIVTYPVRCYGSVVGAICVLYEVDYELDEKDKEILEITAIAIKIEEERKITHDILKEKTQLLGLINKNLEEERGIFYGGPVVVFKRKNEEGLPVEYVSSNVEEILGYTVDDFLSGRLLFLSIIFVNDIKHVKKEIERAINIGTSQLDIEYRMVSRDNRTLWFRDIITLIKDKDGRVTHIFGYIIDITKTKEIELLFTSIFKNAAEGIWVTNNYYELIDLNSAMCDILGLQKKEAVGQSIYKYVDAKSLLTLKEAIISSQEGVKRQFEAVLKNKNGRQIECLCNTGILYDISGKVSGYFTFFNDLSERKTIETALKESEEMFRTLAEGSLAGVILYHETFVYVNPATENITGYSAEELLKMSPWEILHKDFRQKSKEIDIKRIEGARLPYLYNNAKIVRKNGEEKWVQMFTNTVEHKGKYLGLGTIIDITERVKFEQQLQELNSNLERRVTEAVKKHREKEELLIQQSKLASMGEMIGAIAHQWRQPLNILSILVQDLEEAFTMGELDKHYITETTNNCMEQITHMSKTVDDFRRFFVPSKTKVIFDAKKAIDEVLSLISIQLKQFAIEIQYDVKAPLPCNIYGYPNEFKQVILNILNNAKEAVANKTKRRISIELTTHDDTTIIEICDSGGGIKEDYIDKIFEPYFTTKGKGHGTGIGLYMSKTIMEKSMNGLISVSNKGNGALFTLKLPNKLSNEVNNER